MRKEDNYPLRSHSFGFTALQSASGVPAIHSPLNVIGLTAILLSLGKEFHTTCVLYTSHYNVFIFTFE